MFEATGSFHNSLMKGKTMLSVPIKVSVQAYIRIMYWKLTSGKVYGIWI